MSTNKILSIGAVVLLLLGGAFPFYSSSFYDWSRERHNAIAAEQFKIQCPNYPNSDPNLESDPLLGPDSILEQGEIADECGRMLFGYPGFEYGAVKLGSFLALVAGIVLGIVVIIRRIRMRVR